MSERTEQHYSPVTSGDVIERLTGPDFGLSGEELRQLAAEIEQFVGREPSESTSRDATPELGISARESEVLVLLASGYTRRDIAVVLGITFNTAASHVLNIYRKLGVNTIAEATRLAVRSGLVGR